MAYPISDVTRRIIYSGSAGVGPYSFSFEILEQTDVAVYKNSTLLTLTTDYSVTINADGTGSVTLVSAATASDQITLFGDRAIERSTDFVTGGDLFANSLNEELDSQTIFAQQIDEKADRAIKAPITDPTTVDMTLPSKADRADKILAFDVNGNPTMTSEADIAAGISGAIVGANYVVTNATGNGSSVAFTVSSAPGSKSNIQIYIDGVYQNKNTFSISGTTVTFTEAPPSGAAIEFVVGYAIGVGGGAAEIIYTPAGTGAQQTTVQTKLRETVSVKDFGAVGDGVTDDTAAIQAALDYVISQGNVGLNVSGTFLISGTVTIDKTSGDRTPTYIFGGGTFKKTNAGTMFDAANNATSEIFFNNIHFVADAGVDVVAFTCNQEFIRGFFYNCSFGYFDVCFDSTGYLMQSFRINGCDFYGIKSWVIDCGTSGGYSPGTAFDVTVSQSQIEGQSGGLFRGAAGIVVRDCVIENITGNPVMQIINGGAITVADNYFEDCQQGIVVFDANANASGIVISGNMVNLHTGTKFVVWGKTLDGCVTLGNTVNGGQTNDTSQVTSGYVASLYDDNVGGVADGSAVRPVALLRQGSTFTPTVEGSITAGSCTYTVQAGNYQRVGNVITFQLNVGWSSHTGTGNILIKGLPFTSINEFFALSVLPNGITLPSGKVLSAAILGASDAVFLTSTPTDGASGTYAQLAITSYTSGNVIVTGTYLAA